MEQPKVDIQQAMRSFCQELLKRSQKSSLRTNDPANDAFLTALHLAMDYFQLDDQFTIGSEEGTPSFFGDLDAERIIAYDQDRTNPASSEIHACLRKIEDKPHQAPLYLTALVASKEVWLWTAFHPDDVSDDSRWWGTVEARNETQAIDKVLDHLSQHWGVDRDDIDQDDLKVWPSGGKEFLVAQHYK